MREGVDQDHVLRPRKRRQRAEIGQIAGAQNHGIFACLPGGQPRFQLMKQRMRAGDQPRCPGTCSPAPRRLGRRLPQARISGQTEIVIAGEIDEHAPINPHPTIRQPLGRAQMAAQATPGPLGQEMLGKGGKIGHSVSRPVSSSCCGRRPRASRCGLRPDDRRAIGAGTGRRQAEQGGSSCRACQEAASSPLSSGKPKTVGRLPAGPQRSARPALHRANSLRIRNGKGRPGPRGLPVRPTSDGASGRTGARSPGPPCLPRCGADSHPARPASSA